MEFFFVCFIIYTIILENYPGSFDVVALLIDIELLNCYSMLFTANRFNDSIYSIYIL